MGAYHPTPDVRFPTGRDVPAAKRKVRPLFRFRCTAGYFWVQCALTAHSDTYPDQEGRTLS